MRRSLLRAFFFCAAFVLLIPGVLQAQEPAQESSEADAQPVPEYKPMPVEADAADAADAAQVLSYEQRWSEAYRMYRQGLWSHAASAFDALLTEDPSDPRTPPYLSECYLNLGQGDRARQILDSYGAKGPDAPGAPLPPAVQEQDVQPEPPSAEAVKSEPEVAEEARSPRSSKRKSKKNWKDRKLGFTLGAGGNAFGWGRQAFARLAPPLSLGLQVQMRPAWFVSIEGGWGLSRVVAQSWWVGVRAHPVPLPVTPYVGGGIVGEFGNYAARVLWGGLDRPVYPYFTVGGSFMLPKGFLFEAGLNIVWNPATWGQAQLWPAFRFGHVF